MSIVVVGSIAFDSIKTPFGAREKSLGGAANYFAMAARFFSKVQMVGVVGEDFPKNHLEFLEQQGVCTLGVDQVAGQTFHWAGAYDSDLNEAKTLKTELNVFSTFNPRLPDSYRNSKGVFLANIDPILQLHVLEQVRNPDWVALDTMNYWIDSKKRELEMALSRVNIVFINEAEARELSGEHNVIKAGRAIQKLGPAIVVIKRGEYGSLMLQNEDITFAPAFPLEEVVDPTGAGDTFAGGFLGSLAQSGGDLSKSNLEKALYLGTVMASFNIEAFSFDALKNVDMSNIDSRVDSLKLMTV